MKNRLIKTIEKYSSGQVSYEYYKTTKDRFHGSCKRFNSNGHKDFEGSWKFDGDIGVWKWWYSNGRGDLIDTWKDDIRNGVRIEFNYEK